MRKLKSDRSLLMYILLSIVTCGIYSYYFIYDLARDTNDACRGDGKDTKGLIMFIVLTTITCGIYGIIWWYAVAERLNGHCATHGLHSEVTGSSFLLWYILGSIIFIGPFIAMHKLIETSNTVAHDYNTKNGLV